MNLRKTRDFPSLEIEELVVENKIIIPRSVMSENIHFDEYEEYFFQKVKLPWLDQRDIYSWITYSGNI